MKRYRFVAGPLGAATKCPACEASLQAETREDLEAKLQQHLRRHHSKKEAREAEAMIVKHPSD